MTSPNRRPRRALASALCAIAVFAVACSDDTSQSDTSTAASNDEGSAAAFPVSIENMFGTTVIEAKPERVVSIGYTEGDFILALGVTPIAIRDWYGEQPGGLWPWAAESAAANDSITVLQPDTLNFEQIAALEPDVIIAMVSEIEQADYDTLTQIAPVVAQTDEYVEYGAPWDVLQLTIGKALGLLPEAEAIVSNLKAQITAAAADHPEWAGQTTNVVIPATDGSWYAYTDQDSRGRLMTELGFVIPAEILDLAGDLFYAQGSGEQLALIDADLLLYNTFVPTDREGVDSLPLWQSIPAVADGRSLFLDAQLIAAMSFATTLSLPYALEGLIPAVETVLGAGAASLDAGAPDFGHVVALAEEFILADVMTLGIEPVASSASVETVGFQGMEGFDTSAIEVLPMTTLSLEYLASLQPDTIITLQFWVDQIGADLLNGIAEVIIVPDGLYGIERITTMGELLGRPEHAAKAVAEYEAALADATARIAGDCKVSLAAIYPGPSVAAFVAGPWDLPSSILAAGCTLDPSSDDAAPDGNGRVWLSLEQLTMLDSDTLVLLQSDTVEGESDAVAEIEANALWQTLPAVAAERVVVMDRLGYMGLRGQTRFLDDFATAMELGG